MWCFTAQILPFVWLGTTFTLAFLLRRSSRRRQGAILVAVFILWVPCMFLSERQCTLARWEDQSFSGTVANVRTTDNHALKEYSIATPEGEIKILDELGLMQGFNTGDKVEKIRGSRAVEIRK